ncbi:GtrA family protein [Hyphomicrobium denitrificans 1NES1]|uniref:GtrA family protein n=1 Tax=Hyphomicrobium denitrificans 1NES1 TaxID=670307 RepID=N0AZK9_9HYPH|nr:GtrA family protein [Hyphomicrobium denitrificans]AGK56574.1 GtrA family protein [Hyphomicrobium denitrificans 1NES1]
MHSKVGHLSRYTGANVISAIVDYTLLLMLTHVFGMPVLQSAIAYSAAVVVNYGLMKKCVFVGDMSHKSEHRLFMEFVGTGFIGLVLTATVVWLTVHVMKLPAVEGKTVAMVLCFVVLYFVRRHVVFNANPADSSAA